VLLPGGSAHPSLQVSDFPETMNDFVTAMIVPDALEWSILPRAVKSNWFRFDSIFVRDAAETFQFTSISIRYRFDSKNDSI
jgi:hypothetical protein